MSELLPLKPPSDLFDSAPIDAIKPLAEEANIDPWLFLFGQTLLTDLLEKQVTRKTDSLELFFPVRILGEIPIHKPELTSVFIAGLNEIITINSNTSSPSDVAFILHKGLEIGYLDETRLMPINSWPWIAGQREIGEALQSIY